MARRRLILLVAFALLASALAGDATVAWAEERPRPPVVLVVLDALRPDRLGAYGFDTRETSPEIDRLAADAVLFERAYAPAPYTAASVGTMLTGLAPDTHTLTHLDRRLPSDVETLPEVLRAAGYRSLIASRSGILSGFGLQESFDHSVVDPQLAGDMRRFRRTWKRAAADMLAEPGPWLVYLHLFPPHAPYEPPRGFPLPFEIPEVEGVSGSVRFLTALDSGEATLDEAGRDALLARYDGHIRYGDHLLGDALTYLAERADLDRAWIIVTSDHGEAFGEHGRYEHNSTVYEEMVRVPLIVRPPGGVAGGRRVATPVGLVDLFPSILAWAGLPVPAHAAGVALDPAGAEPVPERAHPLTARGTGGAPRFAVLDGDAKLIRPLDGDGAVELYDLATDPGERRDLSSAEPARTARLAELAARELERQRAGAPAPEALTDLDPTVEEGLRALGYIE